jgi:hypothetical protein
MREVEMKAESAGSANTFQVSGSRILVSGSRFLVSRFQSPQPETRNLKPETRNLLPALGEALVWIMLALGLECWAAIGREGWKSPAPLPYESHFAGRTGRPPETIFAATHPKTRASPVLNFADSSQRPQSMICF